MSSTTVHERISILHIITTFSGGGATENTLFSVEGLKSKGYDISIVAGPSNTGEGDLLDRARGKGVRVEILPALVRNIHPWKDLIAFFKLIGLLRSRRVHIAHTHSSKAGILGRLAAFIARTPIVIHTVHGLPFHEYQGKVQFTLFRWAEKVGALLTDKLIAVTNTITEKALKAHVGKAPQFITIRSGFEMEEFVRPRHNSDTLREEFGIGSSDLVVGKIARFSPLKGHRYLVEAIPKVVRKVPSARFLFLGGGESEDELRDLVKNQHVEGHVIFGGFVTPDRIPEVISIMDVVVHTSLLEGLARVLPQALASQKPVVSFDIDGAHEVVIHGKTGYLVPPKDTDRLADSIVDLLQNRSKARQFGQAGRELVQEQWTVGAMVNGIEQVYLQLLSEKRTSE